MAEHVAHPGLFPTCLNALAAQGFELAIDVGDYEDESAPLVFRASRGDDTYVADSPIELLGAVTALAFDGRVDESVEQGLFEAGMARALAVLRERNETRWLEIVREAIDAEDDATPAERLGVSEAAMQEILQDSRLR